MSDEQPPFQPPWQPPNDPYAGTAGGPGGPPGDQPRPWEQGGAWESDQAGGPQYPRQHLLPQEIKPGRNRKPIFIAIGAALALVVAGGIAYLAFRDDGEGTRAAYCAALKDLTHNGDLASAANQPGRDRADRSQDRDRPRPQRGRRRLATLDQGIQAAKSGHRHPAGDGALRRLEDDLRGRRRQLQPRPRHPDAVRPRRPADVSGRQMLTQRGREISPRERPAGPKARSVVTNACDPLVPHGGRRATLSGASRQMPQVVS